MYTEARTIDYILANYTNHVREEAIKVLNEHGYLGIDPRVCNDAPTSLRGLIDLYNDRSVKFFPVNVVGSDKTVFTDPTVNLLFRAWHDLGHILLNAGFDLTGETQVAVWQANRLKGIDKDIVLADVIDQYMYYRTHHKFVEDQRAFVIDKVFGPNGDYPAVQYPEERLYA